MAQQIGPHLLPQLRLDAPEVDQAVELRGVLQDPVYVQQLPALLGQALLVGFHWRRTGQKDWGEYGENAFLSKVLLRKYYLTFLYPCRGYKLWSSKMI